MILVGLFTVAAIYVLWRIVSDIRMARRGQYEAVAVKDTLPLAAACIAVALLAGALFYGSDFYKGEPAPASNALVSPISSPPPEHQGRGDARYVRNADGSVDGYGREAVDEALREVHRQMAADPDGFRQYRECEEECGYQPRRGDPPGEITEEMRRVILARRQACEAKGKRCVYPGRPYVPMTEGEK